jgi:uncharacterized protein (DUF849 family)
MALEASGPSPLAIGVALNGSRRTRAEHPAVPLTAADIARAAAECAAAGATLLHLHVRDEAGQHSLDPRHYREAIEAVRREAGPALIVQISTEAGGRFAPTQQMALVRELRPQAVSVAMREILPDDAVEAEATAFYAWLRQERISVQHILYSPAEAERFVERVRRGVIATERPHALFVLSGSQADKPAEPAALLPFYNVWPADWPFSVCAFGSSESRCMALAASLGGHVRVGFENNLQLPNGMLAASNADLVRIVAYLGRLMGRRVATADQARAIYGVVN